MWVHGHHSSYDDNYSAYRKSTPPFKIFTFCCLIAWNWTALNQTFSTFIYTSYPTTSKWKTNSTKFLKINKNKSEDDDGSRAVFDDVDCFRSQGWHVALSKWSILSCFASSYSAYYKLAANNFSHLWWQLWPITLTYWSMLFATGKTN